MSVSGAFSDTKEKLAYQGSDIRFTVKGNVLYAICLNWPEPTFTIESLKTLYPGEIRSVELLGRDGELAWRMTAEGLEMRTAGAAAVRRRLRVQDHTQHEHVAADSRSRR